MARGRRPSFSQLLHWPSTCGFHSAGSCCWKLSKPFDPFGLFGPSRTSGTEAVEGVDWSNTPVLIHFVIHSWLRSMGKYQCLVGRSSGLLPLSVLRGSIRSFGLSALPHFSHWSPYASGLPQLGQVPMM